MRSIGVTELLVIAALIALLWGLPRLGLAQGGQPKKKVESWLRTRLLGWRWLYYHLGGGSETETIRAEESFGRQLARGVLDVSPAPIDSAAVRRMGSRLAKLVPNRQFQFTVLDSGDMNAYALPGGIVFVTSRLVEALSGDEPGLAFVLGHEMGHVVLEHPADKHFLGAFLSILPGAAPISLLFEKGYSRQQEFEADRQGVEFMRQAGLDAAGATRVLLLLDRLTPAGGGWWATHPKASERVAAIRG